MIVAVDEGAPKRSHPDHRARIDVPQAPGTTPAAPRRRFLRWVGRGALGSLVAMSTLLRSTSAAEAHGYHYACCHLAMRNSGSGCASDCNLFSSYNIRSWSCCYNSYIYVCRECTQSTSCWYGPFLCSYYYRTSNRC